MILVIQRVSRAAVRVSGHTAGEIGKGLLVLGCVEPDDTELRIDAAAKKTAELRIFEDEEGKMNRNCMEAEGAILAVSQFTLGADLSRGRRPGFEGAAKPAVAALLFERFVLALRAHGLAVSTGEFGASMDVELVNQGPATFYWRTPGR